ncbi:MAG: MATE family efflux transporter [Halanaeroarchaeum sp.]
MLQLAWPLLVIQLLQVAYNLADTFWLGRLSADAVGALSLAFPLIFLMISVGGGFTTAGSILVAQYTGAESEGSAGTVAGQTFTFVTFLAIVLGIVGFVSTDAMLGVLPADPQTALNVIPLAGDYMRIFFLGQPFLFGFFVFSSLMRGYGNTRTPMRVMAISVAINVVIDPFLIFGWWIFPAMGIEGAAIATIFSRGVATVIGVYIIFFTSVGPAVSFADLAPDFDIIRKIVRIGVPSATEQSMSAMAMITLTAMVVSFSPPVVAAYGLGNRLISLVFLPAMGLGRATDTMVGQNLGAGNFDRAGKAVQLAATSAAAVLFVIAIVAALFPEPIISVFMKGDTADALETVALGSEYLRIRTTEFVFIGILQVLLGAFRGSGKTTVAMVLSIVALWLGRVPTVYVLAFVFDLGPTGIWIGMALGNILGAIVAVVWFMRGTWRQRVIDEEPGVEAESPADDSAVDD